MATGRTTTVDIDPAQIEQSMLADARAMRMHVDALREVGAEFHRRRWSLGTSSNYSIVVNRQPLELLLTASGKDKGALAPDDFVRVNQLGERVDRPYDAFAAANKPSAETLIHCVLAQQPDVGAVLHTHSVWGTLLGQRHFEAGGLELADYEMLKGLEGISTHETSKWVPIFDNTQNIGALAETVRERLKDPDEPFEHGFLIRRHGLYTWGKTLAEARRHVEIFEFLFECEGRLQFGGAT